MNMGEDDFGTAPLEPAEDAASREALRAPGESSADPVMAAIGIDPLNLTTELVQLPALYAFLSAEHTKAVEGFRLAELEVASVEARCYLRHKANGYVGGSEAGKAKAPTVDAIKAAVEADDEVFSARLEAIKAEAQKNHLWGRLDALRVKRDCLVQLCAALREEMKAEPSFKGMVHAAHDARTRTRSSNE